MPGGSRPGRNGTTSRSRPRATGRPGNDADRRSGITCDVIAFGPRALHICRTQTGATIMQRRDFLFSAIAAVTLGVAVRARAAGAASAPLARRSPPTVRPREGVVLCVRDWGEGRPVLFVHSWAMSSPMWSYQVADLSDQGLRCVAYDRRGHGRSDVPAGGYDMDTFADDLAQVIEQLDLRDVVLVGHSMGCGEILRYVSRHGTGRVARIAFLAPSTPFVLQTADNPHGAPKAF